MLFELTTSVLPEYEVLLDAIAPLGAARADFREWDDSEWDRTLKIADWHRLSPILFGHLRSEVDVPASLHGALEQAYLANAARNLFLAAAQRQVLDALSAAGVPAMLLKGAALVETVYDDPALREMLDLDILVPPDRMDAANAAVEALDYTPLAADEGMDASRRSMTPHHDPALIAAEQVLAVELHRHIAIAGESSGFGIDDVWQRARRSAIGTHLLPAPEDLLMHVCLHFTRNRLGGSYRRRNTGGALAQICDIARIIDREGVDWAALATAARRYHIDAAVFLGLFAARELGVPVPGPALADLRPASFDAAIGRHLVARRVLGAEDHLPLRSARWMLLPSREVLRRGWAADPAAPFSFARAYARRAMANAPLALSALRQPWAVVQDRRLNDQIRALQKHV